jgi:hypothetical protein
MVEQVDQDAWDATAFAAAYQERVIAPADRAMQILGASPYLTRLLSFLSPEEMTADPVFHQRTDLPDHSNEHWVERFERCDEPTRLTYPDGRVQIEVGLQFGTTQFADLPSAERIEQVGEQGAPVAITDNSAEIDEALERENEDAEDEGGVSSSRSALRRRSFACSVASPAWQQPGLWLLALFFVRWRGTRRRTSASDQ